VLPATRQRWRSRPYPSRSRYSIKRPRRDARLSWPSSVTDSPGRYLHCHSDFSISQLVGRAYRKLFNLIQLIVSTPFFPVLAFHTPGIPLDPGDINQSINSLKAKRPNGHLHHNKIMTCDEVNVTLGISSKDNRLITWTVWTYGDKLKYRRSGLKINISSPCLS